MNQFDPPTSAVVEAVGRALAEDLLPLGDLTAALIPPGSVCAARLVSREAGVLAGRACVEATFLQVDASVAVEWLRADGSVLEAGDVATPRRENTAHGARCLGLLLARGDGLDDACCENHAFQ